MNIESLKARLAEATAEPTPPHELTQSRWGWHACSWQTYQKLRLLNQLSLLSRMAGAAHGRWSRKLLENRLIRWWNGERLQPPVPMPEPWTFSFAGGQEGRIVESYLSTRYPRAVAEVAGPSLSPAEIDRLLGQALAGLARS